MLLLLADSLKYIPSKLALLYSTFLCEPEENAFKLTMGTMVCAERGQCSYFSPAKQPASSFPDEYIHTDTL